MSIFIFDCVLFNLYFFILRFIKTSTYAVLYKNKFSNKFYVCNPSTQ